MEVYNQRRRTMKGTPAMVLTVASEGGRMSGAALGGDLGRLVGRGGQVILGSGAWWIGIVRAERRRRLRRRRSRRWTPCREGRGS